MSNRADRRASAKIAKQAVKRAKTPTEGAILRAAAGFAGEGLVGLLGPHISNPDFDAAWARLGDDLHDILDAEYSAFLVSAYVEAGACPLGLVAPDGTEVEMDARLFLCPVSGPQERVLGFTSDPAGIAGLERSLREFGVVRETARCLVLPVVLPIAAFSPQATTPGTVRALQDFLCERLAEALSGLARPTPGEVRAALADLCDLLPEGGGEGAVFGALLGIELVPVDPAPADMSEEEMEAEDMARVAAADSWHDSYAADLEGLTLGAPVDWPACAAVLAWERVRLEMDDARRRKDLPDALPDTIHTGLTGDGERLLLSALYGPVALGPFSAPSDLVWFDADAFFDQVAAGTDKLVEHDDERPVLASLSAAG